VRDEKIVLMDVSKGIAKTDTGRKIQIKREVWDEYKKKDKIEKYDVKSGLGITKSGKKVSLITLLKEPHKLEDKITAIALRRKLPKMVKATYFKDGKLVTEYVVAGDPKLKEIGAIKRAKIKPLTEEEMHRIRETGVRQRQMLMEAAELYQDQLRAQKFLASAFKGKIKPFPKKGYSTYKIMAAYRKRKPPWRLHIRRDHHREEVHMKMVCTNDYLRGREEVHKEVQKILTLMNMRMTPDAIIRDVRPPRVGPKYRWIHIAVKAKKLEEGEIRPRR
jgi:hypothetical protein